MIVGFNTIVARREGLLSAPVDDEIVILNPDRDDYVGLDHVGRAVWDLIETPHRIIDLCQRLSTDFDATPDEIATDVLPFLTEMVGEGIVHVVDG